jgi:hypothetical protein
MVDTALCQERKHLRFLRRPTRNAKGSELEPKASGLFVLSSTSSHGACAMKKPGSKPETSKVNSGVNVSAPTVRLEPTSAATRLNATCRSGGTSKASHPNAIASSGSSEQTAGTGTRIPQASRFPSAPEGYSWNKPPRENVRREIVSPCLPKLISSLS